MPSEILHSLEDLELFTRKFRKAFPKGGAFGLSGELGVGKTTFVRTLIHDIAREHGLELPRVVSPTYVIHQMYELAAVTIDHFDFYRLEAVTRESLSELDYFEAYDRTAFGGWLFVEWPERLPENSPHLIPVDFRFQGTSREVTFRSDL